MATEGIALIVQQAIDAQFRGGEWLTVCILALSISAAMSAIAWMISTFLQSGSLKGWAKEEMAQFIFSASIIALMFPLLMIINTLSIAYVGGDPMSKAHLYLRELETVISEIYGHLIGLKVWFGLLSSVEIPLAIIATAITAIATFASLFTAAPVTVPTLIISILSNITVPYGKPLELAISPISALIKLINPMLFILFVQQELLTFIEKTMLTFILPLGLVMRAFTLTRKTGSTLIAIALAAYIVYPLSIAFGGIMYHQTIDGNPEFQPSYFNPQSPLEQSIVIRESPSLGQYYLDKKIDVFNWYVIVEKANYRVWHSEVCSVGAGLSSDKKHTSSSEKFIPPMDDKYLMWIIDNPGVTIETPGVTIEDSAVPIVVGAKKECFIRLKNGTVAGGEFITFDLSKEDSITATDSEQSFIVDAFQIKEEGGVGLNGTQRSDFYIGDQCQESLWKSLQCEFSSSNSGDSIKNPSYISMSFNGFIGAMKSVGSLAGAFGTAATGGKLYALWTPITAGYAYLYFTTILPGLMFPVAMAMFTFVISAMLFVSSFRSISGLLKGETKLAEIGRLV